MGNLWQISAAVCAGAAMTCVFLFLAEAIRMLREESATVQDPWEKKPVPILFRIFFPLAPMFYPVVRSAGMSEILKQTREKLQMGGYEQTIRAERFLALRLLFVVLSILSMLLFFSAANPAAGALAALIFLLYPTTWLNGIIRRRHLSILKALPNLLDLLTLSVEAGKDFLTALREISERREPDPLNEELLRTLHEIQLGKPRQQALHEMSERVRQNELTSVVNSIIQADELGVSIGQLLRIQGDQLRVKRFARAEKLANEAPVKILFPVVVFIFPSVFLILLGPILAQTMRAIFQS